jgi:protein-tyrosine phosphatase
MPSIFWINDNPPPPLAIVLCPRGGWGLRSDMHSFKRDGIQILVSLLEERQVKMLGLADEGSIAKAMGIQFLAHPLPDHSVPPDEAAFRIFVSGLSDRLRNGERIGIHCLGSIGRSAIVAAGALIHLGWKPDAALAAIKAARLCPVPDTEEQRQWILRYKAQL